MVQHAKLKNLHSYDEVNESPSTPLRGRLNDREAARRELSLSAVGFWVVVIAICLSSLYGLAMAALWLVRMIW